jgi:hypothetical protein
MMKRDRYKRMNPGRRRFLTVLMGMLTFLPGLGVAARPHEPRRLSLHEADFYHPHDLKG